MRVTDSSVQGVDGNGARANEDLVGLERRDFDIGVELEDLGSAERGKKDSAASGHIGPQAETVMMMMIGSRDGVCESEYSSSGNPHVLLVSIGGCFGGLGGFWMRRRVSRDCEIGDDYECACACEREREREREREGGNVSVLWSAQGREKERQRER